MAGLTPAVTSPFGNRGSSLGSPVPGEQQIAEANAAPTEQIQTPAITPAQATPNAQTQQASPTAQPSVDDIVAQWQSEDAGGGMSPLPAPEGLASLREQVREGATRLKNAFTVTTPESLQVLKNSGLFDDVRSVGNVVQVKRKGRQGWENFDRDKIELIGDTLDLSRDFVEGAIENAFRVGGFAGGAAAGAAEGAGAGAAAGSVLPGPGTVAGGAAGAVAGGAAGGVPGAIAGGATGAIVAKNAGDAIAQHLLGIERDPNRNIDEENAVAGAMGAGFSFLGSRFARKMAEQQAAKKEAAKTLDFATKQAQSAMQDIMEVKNSGIVLDAADKFRLDPQQLVGAGNIPELDVTAKELSKNQSFRNFRRSVSDSLTNAYDSVAKALGAQSGKGANLGDDFVLTANDVKNAEGKLIGSFRSLADEKLAGVPQPSPRLYQTVLLTNDAIKTAGHAERQLALNPAQANNFMKELKVITSLMERTGGAIKIDTAQAVQDRLTKQINSHINSSQGRPYAIALMDLRNAVRDDGIDMLESVLPDSYKQMYQVSKGRYRDIIGSTDQLGKLLETENISRGELVNKLFEGKGSYKFAQSAKTLINETNPELWDRLAGEYVQKLKTDAMNPLTGTVNWSQISKKWSGLDPRLQQDVLQSTGIPPGGMDALIRLGNRVQNATFESLPADPDLSKIKGALKQAFIWFGGAGAAAKGAAAGNLIDGMGKDQALTKWLQDGGLEEILKEMPGLKVSKKQAIRDWVNSITPTAVAETASTVNTARKALQPTNMRRRTEEKINQ